MSSLNFKASDLVLKRDRISKLYITNYKREYQKCMDSIQKVSKECHADSTFFTVPTILANDPNYCAKDCIYYLKEHLLNAEFYVREMVIGNCIYISWKESDVEKVKRHLKRKQVEVQKEIQESKAVIMLEREPITWKPTSAISEMKLKTSLMKENPKYSHLKSFAKKS